MGLAQTRLNLSSTLQGIPVAEQPSAHCFEQAGASLPIAQKSKMGRKLLLAACLLWVAFVGAVWLDGVLTRLPSLAGHAGAGERPGRRSGGAQAGGGGGGGLIHAHTNASCGSGTLPQVIAPPKEADLSFV